MRALAPVLQKLDNQGDVEFATVWVITGEIAINKMNDVFISMNNVISPNHVISSICFYEVFHIKMHQN
jgi:hypothetical protein